MNMFGFDFRQAQAHPEPQRAAPDAGRLRRPVFPSVWALACASSWVDPSSGGTGPFCHSGPRKGPVGFSKGPPTKNPVRGGPRTGSQFGGQSTPEGLGKAQDVLNESLSRQLRLNLGERRLLCIVGHAVLSHESGTDLKITEGAALFA
jgi:hypothetical protein